MQRITKDEFNRRYARYLKASNGSLTVLLVIVGAGAAWWQFNDSSGRSVWFALLLAGVALFSIWYGYTYLPKKHGLGCPACGKSMVRYRRFEKSSEKGTCPRCNKEVFDIGSTNKAE